MNTDLALRRRAVLVVYRRYLKADEAWSEAKRDLKTWFPASSRPNAAPIGNPGSRVRQLYEQRERAISQLEVAILKLDKAKQRLAARRRQTRRVVALLPTPVSR